VVVVLPARVSQGLDDNQLRLLYMIARYSHKARSAGEKEKWIRQVPLLVLLYEGIKHGTFDYDYAPQSTMVGVRRVFMNISQEGKDDIDDLRESGLVAAIKLNSKEFQAVTAFQLSNAGYDVLDKVSLHHHHQSTKNHSMTRLLQQPNERVRRRETAVFIHLSVVFVTHSRCRGCLGTGPRGAL